MTERIQLKRFDHTGKILHRIDELLSILEMALEDLDETVASLQSFTKSFMETEEGEVFVGGHYVCEDTVYEENEENWDDELGDYNILRYLHDQHEIQEY